MTTDTERLDWLERARADVFTVTADDWDEGTAPRLLRYTVQADNWKRGQSPAFGSYEGRGTTLREAIDAAMLDAKVPV